MIEKIIEKNKQMGLTFDPKEHRYTDKEGIYPCSCSRLVGYAFPPFRREFYSKKKAKQLGVSQEEMLSLWSSKGTSTASLGTAGHEYLCEVLYRGKKDIDYTIFKDLVPSVKDKYEEIKPLLGNFYKHLTEYYDILAAEQIIADPKYRIAGTIDMLLRHKATGDLVIGDFKFLSKIQTFSKEYSYITSIKASPRHFYLPVNPIKGFSNLNINKYKLQLSVYATMLESYGLSVERGILFCFILGDNWISKVRPFKYKELKFYMYTEYANALLENKDTLEENYKIDEELDREESKQFD